MHRYLCLLLVMVTVVQARVLHVPEDFSTIRSAVSVSVDGDTILVNSGTYRERVILPSGARTLASHYILSRDSADILATRLEPDSGASLDSLTMIESDYADAVVAVIGFTIQNGRGTIPQPGGRSIGGAVLQHAGSLVFERCLFRANVTTGWGAAIYTDSSAVLTVRDCEFDHDSTQVGGIAAQYADVTLTRTRFTRNIGNVGAALWAICCSVGMDSCSVDSNNSVYNTIPVVALFGCPASITHCDFVANGADTLNGTGAALVISGVDNILPDSATVSECRFIDNIGNSQPALGMAARSGWVDHCLFEGNRASWSEGAMLCGSSRTLITNCIYRENSAPWYSVITAVPYGRVDLQNCQFLANSSEQDTLACIGGYLNHWSAVNCTFEGNIPAAVNNASPDVPGVMHMENCYWGDPSGPYHATLNPNGHGQIIYGDSVYFIPWLTEPPQSAPVRSAVPIPSTLKLAAYPNPFNPACLLSVSLPHAGFVTIEVFDLNGRRVQTLLHARLEAGEHTARFDGGRLPSGIYFARVQASGAVGTQKLILLR